MGLWSRTPEPPPRRTPTYHSTKDTANRTRYGRARSSREGRRGSVVEIAAPRVGLELLAQARREPPSVGDGHVGLDAAEPPHAGDHGGHRVVAQDEAQRQLRQRLRITVQQLLERLGPLPDLTLSVALEVLAPEIAGGERAVGGDRPREPALVEGHAGDHAHVVLLAGREELLFRRLVEDVVDDLRRVERARGHRPQRRGRVVVVHRDADEAHLARLLELMERLLPARVRVVEVLVAPNVELEQVDAVEAEVLEALLGGALDVGGGKDLADGNPAGRRPRLVLRRDLGGDVQRHTHLPHELPDEPLAVAGAVGERRVDEVDSLLHRPAQREQALGVLRADPQSLADAPGPESDLRDHQPRTPQTPIIHSSTPTRLSAAGAGS